MWSASIQCRVGMNAKLVGKTLQKIIMLYANIDKSISYLVIIVIS